MAQQREDIAVRRGDVVALPVGVGDRTDRGDEAEGAHTQAPVPEFVVRVQQPLLQALAAQPVKPSHEDSACCVVGRDALRNSAIRLLPSSYIWVDPSAEYFAACDGSAGRQPSIRSPSASSNS